MRSINKSNNGYFAWLFEETVADAEELERRGKVVIHLNILNSRLGLYSLKFTYLSERKEESGKQIRMQWSP